MPVHRSVTHHEPGAGFIAAPIGLAALIIARRCVNQPELADLASAASSPLPASR